MAQPRGSYMVLLIPVFADLVLGKQTKVKRVCSRNSVLLFDSIKANDSDTIVSLYINGDNNSIAATWHSGELKIESEYTNKLGLDGDKNVWILNVNQLDNGSYTLFYKGKTASSNYVDKVELFVLVPPASSCKPKIQELENKHFYASLEGDNCGTPQPSVYWLQYSGNHNEHKDVAKLQAGKEAVTYYACIEGPALNCARSSNQSMDHCTSITIGSTQPDAGCSTNNFLWLLWVIFALQIIWTVAFFVLPYIQKRILKCVTTRVCGRCYEDGAKESEENTPRGSPGGDDQVSADESQQMVETTFGGESEVVLNADLLFHFLLNSVLIITNIGHHRLYLPLLFVTTFSFVATKIAFALNKHIAHNR